MLGQMGRAGLIEVICGLAVVAGVSGCDLLFPPGSSAGSDGPPHDGTTIDGLTGDDDASVLDGAPDSASPADAACGFACNAPDLAPGTPNAGVAACDPAPMICSANTDLSPIETCTCTAGGGPELYLIVTGSTASIGLVAPEASPGATWSVIVDTGSCFGGSTQCAANAACAPDTFLWGWTGIPVTPGTLDTVRFYEDTGAGCNGPTGETYVFTVAVP
jgi:hypothetical protein